MPSDTPRLEKGGLIETGPLSSGSGGGLNRRHARLTLAVAGRCHRHVVFLVFILVLVKVVCLGLGAVWFMHVPTCFVIYELVLPS